MNFFGSSAPVHFQKPADLRLACRAGSFDGVTSGHAPGYAQGNVTILPQEYVCIYIYIIYISASYSHTNPSPLYNRYAYDFLLYCTRNPKSCPLLHVLEQGHYAFGTWGKKVDLRTDLPK